MTKYLLFFHRIVWGAPALVLILGIGLYLSVLTGFVQLRLFPRAVREFAAKLRPGKAESGISPFQALCTALAATVGTGNLIGVAGAICIGGPGAIFWMWICGFLGMGTKYAEVTLALHYRVSCGNEYLGGPMYTITRGMGEKWRFLACIYALFGIVAAFGVGNATQISALIAGINSALHSFGSSVTTARSLGFGLVLAVMVGFLLLGGSRRIARVAEGLVPLVSCLYITLCILVLILHRSRIPQAFSLIFQGAFSPAAVSGGILGSAMQALRTGCARGVFTNEAGMGTASMAHAGAKVNHPAEQGLLGIVEVFLDTIVICTLTALVILVSGVAIPYGTDAGSNLTSLAFCHVFGGWASVFLAAALACFAFATVLGWSLYGARCAQFLFGAKAWTVFSLAQTAAVVLGSVVKAESLWLFAETLNGAMAIPNLIALAALAPQLRRLTIEYERKSGAKPPVEVHYANFHQRKPLRTLSHAEIPSSCRSRQESR